MTMKTPMRRSSRGRRTLEAISTAGILLPVHGPVVRNEDDLVVLGNLLVAVAIDVGDERRRLGEEILAVELQDLRELHDAPRRIEAEVARLAQETLRFGSELALEIRGAKRRARQAR